MTNLHDDLARARRAAPASTLDLEGLHTRRDRKHTRRRVGASIVALSICVAMVGGAVSVLQSEGTGEDVAQSPAAAGSTFGPPVDVTLAVGQYTFTRTTD
ncbi:MAG: hypothetical protein ABI869_05735 [Actinomycetota bacterium]